MILQKKCLGWQPKYTVDDMMSNRVEIGNSELKADDKIFTNQPGELKTEVPVELGNSKLSFPYICH
jgi:hypothetical protein